MSSSYFDPMWWLVRSTWQNLESSGIWVSGHACEDRPKLTSMRRTLLTMGEAIPGQGILDCAEWRKEAEHKLATLCSWLCVRRACRSIRTLELWAGRETLSPLSCVPEYFITAMRKERKMPHTAFLLSYKDSMLSLWLTDSKQPFPSHFDWVVFITDSKAVVPLLLCAKMSLFSGTAADTGMFSSGNNVIAIEFCTEADGAQPTFPP